MRAGPPGGGEQCELGQIDLAPQEGRKQGRQGCGAQGPGAVVQSRGGREGRVGRDDKPGLREGGPGPQEHGSCQSNKARPGKVSGEASGLRGRALTSLSWKGLERMVRLPSSMDFWNLVGICRPCSLS